MSYIILATYVYRYTYVRIIGNLNGMDVRTYILLYSYMYRETILARLSVFATEIRTAISLPRVQPKRHDRALISVERVGCKQQSHTEEGQDAWTKRTLVFSLKEINVSLMRVLTVNKIVVLSFFGHPSPRSRWSAARAIRAMIRVSN